MSEQITYFAARHRDGALHLLFRIRKNDETQALTMERLSPREDVWVDDPTLIDELREPGVTIISEHEARTLAQAKRLPERNEKGRVVNPPIHGQEGEF